jgi:hypothetical protein
VKLVKALEKIHSIVEHDTSHPEGMNSLLEIGVQGLYKLDAEATYLSQNLGQFVKLIVLLRHMLSEGPFCSL